MRELLARIIQWWFWHKQRNPGFCRKICNLHPDNDWAVEHIDRLNVNYDCPERNIGHPIRLTLTCSPVKNQGWWGSCGSHAAVAWMECALKNHNLDWEVDGSERYHYWLARSKDFEGSWPSDAGMSLSTTMEVLQRAGMTLEKLCPYDWNEVNEKPGVFAGSMARFWRVKNIRKLVCVQEVIEALADGWPVIVGVWADKGFLNLHDELVPDYAHEKLVGGHALLAIGYDLIDKTIIFKNSWGYDWGRDGFCKIKFDDLKVRWIGAVTARL